MKLAYSFKNKSKLIFIYITEIAKPGCVLGHQLLLVLTGDCSGE